jgi:hypothetical protein
MREGQGSWDRTTEMGQPWQDSHDSKVGARHLGHDIGYDTGQESPDRSVWTGQPDSSAWTGQAGQVREGGMPRQDSKDRIFWGQVT